MDEDCPEVGDHPLGSYVVSGRAGFFEMLGDLVERQADLRDREEPNVIGEKLNACPTFVRLDRILGNQDGVSAGELQHVALCTNCVARVRAFRRFSEVLARDRFEERLRTIRRTASNNSDFVRQAERAARRCFTLLEQDADLVQWQSEAWKWTHTIARDLRRASERTASIEELSILIDFRMSALGSASANPTAACARMFDAAWPLVEMIKEAAAEVVKIGRPLFRPFARAVGLAGRTGGPRMKAMLAYASVELMDLGETSSELAVMIVREIGWGDGGDPPPVFMATLLHRRTALPADLRTSLSASLVYAPRLYEVIRNTVRGRHAVEAVLGDPEMTTETAIDRILPVVRRFVDDLFAASDPDDALLRLVGFRRFLRDVSRFSPDNDISMIEVFRAIGRSLVARADASHGPGSTFLIIKAIEIIVDVFPEAYASLAELLPAIRVIVRQGLIISAAQSYEVAFKDDRPADVPRFVRAVKGWWFNRGVAHGPADLFCALASRSAGEEPTLNKHLRWLNDRLAMSCSSSMAADVASS